MPRTRLVVRQILLTLGSLLTCFVAGGAAGALYSRGLNLIVVVLSTVFILLGLFGMGMVWFIGEDQMDVEPQWIVPMTIASICLLAVAPIGVGLAYLEVFGERVAVVITEDGSGESTPGTYQAVRVATVASGEDVGEMAYKSEHDLQVGDRLEALVDPRGWFLPDTMQSYPPLRNLGYGFTGTGLGLLLLMTVLRTRRDLRRYRLTGTRQR
ncbi:hypothetical protein [Micromonospora sp. NBC_01412]|uniref:hypothetical protein n=1 Tax=Micromonospora sp. NBC_01412 TaxID=2903590 RepID=UPI0032495620